MTQRGEWRIRHVTEPDIAIDCARGLVSANPVAYSVFSTVTGSLLAEPSRYADPHWYVVEDAQRAVVLVAIHTDPHPLHLPEWVPGPVTALGEHLAATGRQLPGVSGPKDAALDFADAYLGATGRRIRGREGIGVYDLPVPVRLPRAVCGEHRQADESHLALVVSWVDAFLAETAEGTSDAEATARSQLAAGNVSLWVVDGRPVSMCWASAPYSGVVRVSGVFTPRADRGHGYASAVVAEASRRQQDRGHTCMLYTHLANATSNKIYRALGYRHRGDDLRLTFTPR